VSIVDRVMRHLIPPLVWEQHPPEVPGELTYIAERSGRLFWVKKEPHETKWTCIVTDLSSDPWDLKCDAGTLEDAKQWCEDWKP
jgi:hypothetical protein